MIREVIAKRLSGVIEYKSMKTPIMREIAIPAREVEHRAFHLNVESLGRIYTPQDFLDWFKGQDLPDLEWGKAYGEYAGQWYRVNFSKVLSNPQVVAVAEGRSGEIIYKDVKRAPSADVPSVSIAKPSVSIASPRIDISIPTVSIEKVEVRAYHCKDCDFGWLSVKAQTSCLMCGSANIEEITYGNKYEWVGWYLSLWNAKKQLGDWRWGMYIGPYWAGFDLNWIRDFVATAWAWFGYYFLGRNSVFVLFDAMSAQVDKIRESIQTAINQAISNTKIGVQSGVDTAISNVRGSTQDAVNRALDNVTSSVQTAFNRTIDALNSKLPEQTNYLRDRINERLNDLYAMWGIPEGIVLTPVHIRNITSTGFEFLSLGKTTIHWIAVGD